MTCFIQIIKTCVVTNHSLYSIKVIGPYKFLDIQLVHTGHEDFAHLHTQNRIPNNKALFTPQYTNQNY